MSELISTRKTAAILDEMRQTIERAERVVVVSHVDPDGDALGTQLAFGRYLNDIGKQVRLVRDSEIPRKYRWLPDIDTIVDCSTLPPQCDCDTLIVLECPSTARMGTAARFVHEGVSVMTIDHHPDSVPFGEVNWLDVQASSVGEMVYEFFSYVDYEISETVATQLYTAILTDTGRFRYNSATTRTFAIAGELVRRGADPRQICDAVYFNQHPAALTLFGKVLNTLEFHRDGLICCVTLTRQMLDDSGADNGDSDGLVDFTLHAKGVRCGAIFKEQDSNQTKVSLRSHNGIDVSLIARRFGGGGHENAAGCQVPQPLSEAKKTIIKLLAEACSDAS